MNPKLLLIVTGSIAAVKIYDVIRGLRAHGAEVTCVLTESAKQFVTPLSLASLTGNPVYEALFSAEQEARMDHIALSRSHDVILVAPASANFLAKMAHGLADDLASTLALATDKKVLVAPAMNVRMWGHPATRRNVSQLQEDGVIFLGPVSGSLACGEEGFGRMAEPEEIVAGALSHFPENASAFIRDLPVFTAGDPGSRHARPGGALSRYKAIVTSGPTREAIDPVRYLSNRSSGKQGHAIARALAEAGAEVTLVSGPTGLPDPQGCRVVHVESAQEMYDAVHGALPADIAVCVAAVSDWRTEAVSKRKIKKTGKGKNMTFTFAENPDILVSLAKHKTQRPTLVIGFAAETEHLLENARVKLESKGCDWILANDVACDDIFGGDENTVHLVTKTGEEAWKRATKEEVARKLVARIASHCSQGAENSKPPLHGNKRKRK